MAPASHLKAFVDVIPFLRPGAAVTPLGLNTIAGVSRKFYPSSWIPFPPLSGGEKTHERASCAAAYATGVQIGRLYRRRMRLPFCRKMSWP